MVTENVSVRARAEQVLEAAKALPCATLLAAKTASEHGFPRILGVLMALGWLTFLLPPLGAKYQDPYILVAAIGQGLLTLWLLVTKRGTSRLLLPRNAL